MEYCALILNRSFLVFITEGGLRGWQFHGMITSLEPMFYEPVEALLDDPDMAPGSAAFEELMQQRHTFFMPYAEIVSVEFIDRRKWGMVPSRMLEGFVSNVAATEGVSSSCWEMLMDKSSGIRSHLGWGTLSPAFAGLEAEIGIQGHWERSATTSSERCCRKS